MMVQDKSAHVSGHIIALAISRIHFSFGDIQSELDFQVNREQIEQILSQLMDDGWVEKPSDSSLANWKAGPLARKYGDMVTYGREYEGIIPVLPDERSEDEF